MAGFGVYGGGGTTGAATEATLLDVENELVLLNATAATLATEATLAAQAADVASLAAEDFATQTTLAAIAATLVSMEADLADLNTGTPDALGQQTMANSQGVVIASDQTAVPVSAASLPLPTGAATEVTLAAAAADLNTLAGFGFATETTLNQCSVDLSNIAAEDFSTETTLAAMSAKLPAALGAQNTAGSMAVNIASDQTVPVSAASLPLPTGAATQATLASLLAKTGATPIVSAYDEVAITYVTVGNGIGEIQTVVWKLATATVKTATLSYDANDKLSGVVWS